MMRSNGYPDAMSVEDAKLSQYGKHRKPQFTTFSC